MTRSLGSGGLPSRKLLRRGWEKSFSWVVDHFDLFRLDGGIFPGCAIDNLKHGSELALVLHLHARLDRADATICTLMGRLWHEAFRGGDALVETILVRPDLAMALSTYASFKGTGFESPKLESIALHYASCRWALSLPLPFWRVLDIANAFSNLGLLDFSEVPLHGSYLRTMPPPALINTEIGYAITHELFYLTDFGRRTPDEVGLNTAFLHQALDYWAEFFLSRNDIDLFSEFLLAKLYCHSKVTERMFLELLKHQQSDGSFRGPERAQKAFPSADGRTTTFRENYHTTLVCLVLLRTAEDRMTASGLPTECPVL